LSGGGHLEKSGLLIRYSAEVMVMLFIFGHQVDAV
jgi:hypothetical protein